MKIGIILHPYGEKHPAGLHRTIFEWTSALLRNDRTNDYFIFLKEKPRFSLPLPGKNWRVEVLGGGFFWLDRLCLKEPADVYIFNTPVLPLFFRPKRSIVIALDFGYLYFSPKGWQELIRNFIVRLYHGFSLRRAGQIVAISEASKNDVMRFFHIPESKIKVIYCGFKKICETAEEPVEAPDKFFLFAGVIKERKNVFNIVRAFNDFHRKEGRYKLVIGGKGEGAYYEAILKFIAKNNLDKEIIFLGHLNDRQLSFLYKKAEALIFPSIVEGFGFPVLEAMHCGLPVITSNVSSLAELGANNAALLVNPQSVGDIAEAMSRIVKDNDFRQNLIRNGFLQVQRFSWDKAAEELLDLITV